MVTMETNAQTPPRRLYPGLLSLDYVTDLTHSPLSSLFARISADFISFELQRDRGERRRERGDGKEGGKKRRRGRWGDSRKLIYVGRAGEKPTVVYLNLRAIY